MYLLSLFNQNGMKQIGVEVDSNPSFLYVDDRSTARDSDHPSWNVNFADGRWHRVAWSVRTEQNGDSTIELYVDCRLVGSRVLKRNGNAGEIASDGIVIFGRNGHDGGEFEGDIQQFDLYDDPTIAEKSAANNCRKHPEYTIRCDNPKQDFDDSFQAAYQPDNEYDRNCPVLEFLIFCFY